MTNEKKFKKIIERAINNGLDILQFLPAFPSRNMTEDKVDGFLYGIKNEIIWRHDFLKAFFGESKCKCMKTPHGILHADKCKERDWQYHAQQMVISEEPIKYLEKHL